MITGCPMGRFCYCDDARRGACRWSPAAPSPDAAEHAARVDARRAERAALARAIREGRAFPPAGDLFDRPEAGILPGLPLFTPDAEVKP